MSTAKRILTKPFVVMPMLAVLVLGGWWLWSSRSGDETVAEAASSQLVAATTGTMSRTVSAEGTVAVADSEDLSFAASGTVTAVNVTAGQAVKAGDVLATIDSAELAAAVGDAETALAEAQAQQYDNYVAGASYTQQTADQASVATAEDRLVAANEDLAGAQLVASFDGTIATVDLTTGEELGSSGTGGTTQTGSASGSGQSSGTLGSSTAGTGQIGGATGAAGGTTATTSTAQIQVVSSSTYVVELGLDDTDIAQVAVGQTATIALSTATSSASGFPGGGAFPGGGGFPGGGAVTGLPGGAESTTGDDGAAATDAETTAPVRSAASTTTGTVTEVGQVADASSGVATYPVTVSFTDTTGDFNAGATVQVDITYAEVTDVVQVPSFAVTTSGGTSTVTVSVDGEEQPRTVETGLTSGTMVEITNGLSAGEQVVVAVRGPGGQTGRAAPGSGDLPQGFPGAPTDAPAAATEDGSDG